MSGREDPPGGARLLFVCTGNTCRSPLAEAVAREAAAERGLDRLECRSAGVMAAVGEGASRGAVLAAREVGLGLYDHSATELSPELVRWADRILCMTESHRRAVSGRGGEDRAVLLTEYLPADHPAHGRSVPDPAGGELDTYRQTLSLLREAVGGLLDELSGAGGRREP